jgi:hypothetical protein
MKKNMGTTDRIIRVIIAAIITILYITGTISGTLGIVLLIAAAMFAISSITAYCPMYALFGLSTMPGAKRYRGAI